MSKTKYPTSRPKQIALAQAMINGLTSGTTDFPAPTVKIQNLQEDLEAAQAATNARIAAAAALREATDAETAAYDELNADVKTDLKYAELVTGGDDAKLKLIGWSGRAAPVALQPPGVPRAFEIVEQGKGFAHFDWKEPADGGAVRMYRVMMMEVAVGTGATADWRQVASEIDSEAVVTGLSGDGKQYIFCAVAVNAAGESGQSNTVTAFL